MAGLTEFYCGSNETSHGSQFKWLDNTFNQERFFNKTLFLRETLLLCTTPAFLDTVCPTFRDSWKTNLASQEGIRV
jgi:hypothetical protein